MIDIQRVNDHIGNTINEIRALQTKFNDISPDNIKTLLEKINQNNTDLKELSETSPHHIQAQKLDISKSKSLRDTVKLILDNKGALQGMIDLQGTQLAPVLFAALENLHGLLNRNLKDIKIGDKVEPTGESSAL